MNMKHIYQSNAKKDKNKVIQIRSGRTTVSFLKKSVKLFLIATFLSPLFWSCEFLDYTESDYYNQEEILTYQDRTANILNNIYSYLPSDLNGVNLGIDGAMRSSASDDAIDVWDVSDIQKFNDGSWNSVVVLDNVWNNMYAAIRTANVFIKEATGRTFDDTKWNEGYADAMKAYKLYPYEARFLRAFYYFELIKRYRNVPLDTTVLTIEEANKVSPASFDDIVKFISRECDSAAAKLPNTFTTFISTQTGRATKGAAMALKARTLLYAASPLHNPTNDLSKWTAAAQAAKNLMDALGTQYTTGGALNEAYTAVTNSLSSKELIFERRRANDRTFEEANTARGFLGGNTGTCPTQNLVDAYEMKTTGLGINETGSGYNPATPYSTTGATARDPRLAMTILFNGAEWKSPAAPAPKQYVQTYYGGLNGAPTPYTTKTGYYLRKYMVESISLDPTNPGTALHVWVLFRYSEVLLNYAEAMNEAFGPDNIGPGTLNVTARAAVNVVRARTGVAMPPFPAAMSQSAFRDKLRNERRVELAFEDHRFWDLRRWKIGPSTTTILGVDLTRDPNTSVITYTPKVVETRIWDDKMYLYPIPQTEIFINNRLGQNTGW
jgi:starch-binding outer membrane protein, SusD/RagB family